MTREDFFEAYRHCLSKISEYEFMYALCEREYGITDDIYEDSCIACDVNNRIYLRNMKTPYRIDDVLKVTYSIFDGDEAYIYIRLRDDSEIRIHLWEYGYEIELSYIHSLYYAHYRGEDRTDILRLTDALEKTEASDGLTIVYLEDEVRLIEAKNTQQTHITIPEGVTAIGRNVFEGFSAVEQVDFPNSIRIIGYGAFEGCSSLHSIRIESPTVIIDSKAFNRCSSLESVEIISDDVRLWFEVFRGCTALSDIKICGQHLRLSEDSFNNIGGENGLKHLVVPEGTDLSEVLGLEHSLVEYTSVASSDEEIPIDFSALEEHNQ